MLTRTLKNTTLRNPHDYDTILDAVVDMYEVEVGSSAKGMSGTSKCTEETRKELVDSRQRKPFAPPKPVGLEDWRMIYQS